MPDELTHVVIRFEPDRHRNEKGVIYAEAGLQDEDDVKGAIEYPVRVDGPMTGELGRVVIEKHLDVILEELAAAVREESGIRVESDALRRHVQIDYE